MKLHLLTPAGSLNKAYFKQSIKQEQIELFKSELKKAFNHIDENQDEEYHKNIISHLLTQVYCKDKYLVNVNKKEDLIIRLGNNIHDPVGVILEFKKPVETKDIVSADKPNVKALQELVLYYLRETIDKDQHEIKRLIATNIYEWFILDEVWFENHIFKNPQLKKDYLNWKVSGHGTDHFYKFIAAKHLDLIEEEAPCTYFTLKDIEKFLDKTELNEKEEEILINLFKILSPEHLLKLPFANDSNSLNKEFYNELLHLIGLEETKDSTKKIIQRKSIDNRNEGSLIENTITILKRTKAFGYNTDEETEHKYFELALELNITWLNRILFLKLLEGQLIKYNNSNTFAFLNIKRIKDFDELNELFFEVLAVPANERENSVAKLFSKIPYLNSSLFEQTDLEKKHQGINQLKDRLSMPIYNSTVFKDGKGKRIIGEKPTMQYLFEFLEAYDFASESSAKIQKENKSVINASVLGLIFEKINGYKDGSFFTPGFITMYMCRETIHKVVVQKFNDVNEWNCKTIEQVKDKIDYTDKEERSKANDIINAIKICDPAVGSGHFLVSALNALIEVKSFLKILNYRNESRVKGFKIEIANDELIITNEETDKLFEYKLNKNGKPITELQELQETLFHEKQNLIEKSLFGVDINPKSAMICRLRLWIELLKNSYYTEKSKFEHLETLPNIDINIKCGNSLISRFAIDDKNSMLPKDRPYIATLIEKYKILVDGYKNALDKKAKDDYRRQIAYSKTEFEKFTLPNDKAFLKLKELKEKLGARQFSFFFDESEKAKWITETETLSQQITELEKQYTEKLETIYGNAFEWRFEFPEVLNEEGQFNGFDLVIGNPPYFSLAKDTNNEYYRLNYQTFNTAGDIYCLFYEQGFNILNKNGSLSFISSNKWMRAKYGKQIRNFILQHANPYFIFNFSWFKVFENASVDTNILSFSKSENENLFKGASAKPDFKLNELSNYAKFNSIHLQFISGEYWNIVSSPNQKLKQKISELGKPLEAWSIKINYGIKTGFNEAFNIDEKTKDELILKDQKNVEIIKPFLRGRDIERYGYNFANLYLINTYNGFIETIKNADKNIVNQDDDSFLYKSENSTEWKPAKRIEPAKGNQFRINRIIVETDYPTVFEYLKQFETPMKKREDQGNHWTNLRNCAYDDEFGEEKLVWAETMRVHKTGNRNFPRFGYDDKSTYTDKTVFICVGHHLKYLLSFLNSNLGRWLIMEYVSKLDTGGYMMQKDFLDKIPVIQPDESTEAKFNILIDQILEKKKMSADTSDLENKIDEMVYNLYNLTEEEIKIVANA